MNTTKLQQFFWGKYFFIQSPFVVIILIHIFCTPTYILLSPACKIPNDICNMQAKIDRKDHLFESVKNKFDPTTHMAKTEFRLTPPFLAKVFQITTKVQMYLLQFVLGFTFFFLLTRLMYNISNNKVITFFVTASFGFLYTGYSFFSELLGIFDCFAFLFLLIAMMDTSIVVMAISLFLAFWTDERAIISSLLIIFWWQYKQLTLANKNFFLPAKQSYVIVLVAIIYFALRFYLITNFGFQNQFKGSSFSVIKDTINFYGLTVWQMFEGFWLIVISAFYKLIKDKKNVPALFFVLINLMLFISSLCIYDNTRSIAYAFPSIIISFFIIKDAIDLKKMSSIALLFCFIFPSYFYICGAAVTRHDPIYIRILNKIINAKTT